jgi:hypothetical protein
VRVLIAALLLAALPFGTAPAQSLYSMRNVPQLLRSTRGITQMPPMPDSNGRPEYQVAGAQLGGFVSPEFVDDGFLANGQEVLIVPLVSGGSGGVFTTLLWTRTGGGAWKFVGPLQSGAGHLAVYIVSGKLNVITPIYVGNDPNCCPSNHHHEIDTIEGTKLRVLERFNDK